MRGAGPFVLVGNITSDARLDPEFGPCTLFWQA
jgi:hypothetical protein